MQTTIESRSRTVVIGDGAPFCVIGERINPTGRKAFQVQLQAGDLSQLEIDVAEQVAGGADVLDVNVGDPLADEIELMRAAVPLVQGLTDLPLCIDSSVIEALEAGLAAYEGKALVNSVTGEDERLDLILPIVARHGAAVIGLANDDEIPMEPERRLEVARKIVSVAGDHGIPPEDVVIDPLAMPVGAEPRAVTLFLETVRLIRDDLGVNMTCGACNTSFGLPGRHTLGAAFLAVAKSHGLTSAIMDARSRECVESVRATDFLLGHDEWGARWIAAHRAKLAARQRSRWSAHAGGRRAIEPGTGRVRLSSAPDGGEVRVPAGTTVFDAASWNGIAIDSTCGGHGTCKKCKVRITDGEVPIDTLDPRAFSARRAARRLAAGLPRDRHPRPRRRGAAAADPPQGGAGRRRPPRDPAPVGAEALPGAGGAVAGGSGRRHGTRGHAVDDFELRVELGAAARHRPHPARVQLQGHRRDLRRHADRRRARRYQRAAACDRLRPGHDHGGGHAARPGHRPAAGGALDAEPPAAVRRRRDLARVGHDDRPGRAGDAAAAGA